ncbi:MAG: hypothetical protein E6K70_11975 [Planctomycetota bacterium]|nr:MAG: hypothetical protein E6K70_11975 [Planctomycetota bacterium]
MPVVKAGEVEDARALNVQSDIEVIGLLVEKVAGVGPFIASGAVIGATQVGAGADALVGPALPLAVGIQAYRDHRWFLGRGA